MFCLFAFKEAVLTELGDCGYTTFHRVLSSRPLVAQRRERLYFVGFRDNLPRDVVASFTWPTWAAAADADIAELQARRGEEGDTTGPTAAESAGGWPTVRAALEPPSQGWPEHELSAHKWEKVVAQPEYIKSSKSRLVELDGAARTLISSYRKGYAHKSEFVPPTYAIEAEKMLKSPRTEQMQLRPRFFTPRECCRLQGFPDQFVTDVSANPLRFYHMIGNAVCVPAVQSIAERVVATGAFAVCGTKI
eukprot:SAG31_NODE_6823_length_1877_cov_1.897075_1_plen_248_part_00